MMSLDEVCLVRQSGDIVSETIGDETIIVDLSTGRYHRVVGAASAIWGALETRTAWQALLVSVARLGFRVEASAVARHVAKLCALSLVEIDDLGRSVICSVAEAASPEMSGDLAIESYDDMAELLLLDPVHDVGEQGWPAQPTETG